MNDIFIYSSQEELILKTLFDVLIKWKISQVFLYLPTRRFNFILNCAKNLGTIVETDKVEFQTAFVNRKKVQPKM